MNKVPFTVAAMYRSAPELEGFFDGSVGGLYATFDLLLRPKLSNNDPYDARSDAGASAKPVGRRVRSCWNFGTACRLHPSARRGGISPRSSARSPSLRSARSLPTSSSGTTIAAAGDFGYTVRPHCSSWRTPPRSPVYFEAEDGRQSHHLSRTERSVRRTSFLISARRSLFRAACRGGCGRDGCRRAQWRRGRARCAR